MDKPKLKLKETFDETESSVETKIDIHDILKSNLEREQAADKPLILNLRKSRKKRDYLACLIIVNPVLTIPYFLLEMNLITLVFTLAATVTFTVGFSWFMWQVMSDY